MQFVQGDWKLVLPLSGFVLTFFSLMSDLVDFRWSLILDIFVALLVAASIAA